jgi:secondary thiamine-phosphate synthase enzyme
MGGRPTELLRIKTRTKAELVDVTSPVAGCVHESGIQSGVCQVYVSHTTAGVLINENADPGVLEDILATLDRLVPWNGPYRHIEDNAAAHIKAILVGTSQTIPVRDGKLALGRWQGIFLAEFDGPRERELRVTMLPG